EERHRKEEEEAKRKADDEMKKKKVLSGMGANFGGFLAKVISSLVIVFPRQRAQEMWNWIYQLESEKFDFMEHMKHQKYEIIVLLNRIQHAKSLKRAMAKGGGWSLE
ncbi:hypothetical protein INR49_032648, partial [Caranx melampygus]